VVENINIDSRTEVIDVREEDVFLSFLLQFGEALAVVEGLVHITVARRIPLAKITVKFSASRLERVLVDTGEAVLVEGEDGDVRVFVLLEDLGSFFISVEGVHQNERHVDSV